MAVVAHSEVNAAAFYPDGKAIVMALKVTHQAQLLRAFNNLESSHRMAH